MSSIARESGDGGSRFSRIEAQFDLSTAPWLKRAVGRVVMLALGGVRAPHPEAGEAELGRLVANSLKVEAGYRINYLEGPAAKGRPVIFIHGTPGNASGWADYLLSPPEGLRCIALDRPGFGASGPRNAEISVPAQANAVAAVIRALRSGPAILVGHSFGAPVAVQAAADAPDLVAALVVLAGSLDPALERVPAIQHLADVWPVREVLPRALRNANSELIALRAELVRLEQKLPGIKAPSVIVHGTADKLVPFENVAFLKAHLTGAAPLEIVEIEGQDHFLPWNAKPHVLAAIARAAALSS